jgi:polyhydroxyalkanoate synthesis regulator phasin
VTTVRENMEQAVLMSIGAASLTREKAEAAVADLVRKGQMGTDEGKQVVERLMARVRGDGAAGVGLVGKLEGGMQGVMRELGIVTRGELEDVTLRLSELEHRISLLERGPAPAAGDDPDTGAGTAPA